MKEFNGLHMNLGNLSRLSNAKTRSLSAENPTGGKGMGAMADPKGVGSARDLGVGFKVSPCIFIPPHETTVFGEIEGSGAIQQIWMTTDPTFWRTGILRMYWDGEETPSVEVPVGDFFCQGWGVRGLLSSLPISVGPAGGLNCYFSMPFRKGAKLTMENRSDRAMVLFYQVNYTLTDVPEDEAYFHAQFRRTNPTEFKVPHTILDGVKGKGQYVGTYLAWGVNSNGWWGEGEIKFYMDGDGEFPTICGTGTEDYFGGAWNFEFPGGKYCEYQTPYCGMNLCVRPNGLYNAQQRFSLYRWHIQDPVRFDSDLKVTIQALGWQQGGRYLPLRDDIASTAYWYQTEPHAEFPKLGSYDELAVFDGAGPCPAYY